jgi:hypothetical protein
MTEGFECVAGEFHLRSRFSNWGGVYTQFDEFQLNSERGSGLFLLILQDVVAGDGVAEYGSEEDV